VSDAGYTLTEMLVAMMMASLALGGVAAASQMIAKSERKVAESRVLGGDLRRVDNEMRAALAQAQWFETGDRAPTGDGARFTIGCGLDDLCKIELRPSPAGADVFVQYEGDRRALQLRNVSHPRLIYLVGGAGGSEVREVAPSDGTLRAILLTDGQQRLAIYRIVPEQRSDCSFDGRTGDCETAAP
jgi:prepilin-type N-terminal cleavage/methylation domain-containing protein